MRQCNIKYTIDDCRNTAIGKGGLCLSSNYANANEKLQWQCKNKHIWHTTYSSIINRDRWCKICAGYKNITIKDCHKIANNRGGECLSEEYINNSTQYLWKCIDGHRWNATYANVNAGTWCPDCAPNKRNTIEDCHKLAKLNNGKCLSTKYINSCAKLRWECNCSCKWYMNYDHAKQGQWCPKCAGVVIVTIEDCHKLAKLNNGKCLSTKYINGHTHLEWQCINRHKWCATHNNVKRGTWCPTCNTGKTQKALYDIIQKMFPSSNVYNNYKKFDWLKTVKNGKQELDIFVEDARMAIEYDGEQHFIPVCFGGISLERATKNLQQTQLLDNIKNKKIEQCGGDIKYFIRFNYLEDLTYEYVREKISKAMSAK